MTTTRIQVHPADLWNLALSLFAVGTFGAVLVWIVSL